MRYLSRQFGKVIYCYDYCIDIAIFFALEPLANEEVKYHYESIYKSTTSPSLFFPPPLSPYMLYLYI